MSDLRGFIVVVHRFYPFSSWVPDESSFQRCIRSLDYEFGKEARVEEVEQRQLVYNHTDNGHSVMRPGNVDATLAVQSDETSTIVS